MWFLPDTSIPGASRRNCQASGRFGLTGLFLVLSLPLVNPAFAATAEERCEKKKLLALGKRTLCLDQEISREVLGKTPDFARCAERFDKAIADADKAAAKKGTSCRWLEPGDGTAVDLNTGLQWEMKTDDGSVHDKDNLYTWSSSAAGKPDGEVFADFLGSLNAGQAPAGGVVAGCFADACDWRIPTIRELRGIVDDDVPGCWEGSSCTSIPGDNPVAEPDSTISLTYWTSITNFGVPEVARVVDFFNGFPGGSVHKVDSRPVRAVRGGGTFSVD